jgi:heparanase
MPMPFPSLSVSLRLAALLAVCVSPSFSAESSTLINPATLPAVGQVDGRFQAYNIEMLEVTGGQFWKPYKDMPSKSAAPAETGRSASAQAGSSASLYQYRPPLDLSNARLRKLAAALGPTYVRVSGTWANSTYFHDTDGPAPATPPEGFQGVLTRQEWKGVVDFAKAVNAEIITSFATSPGTRNAEGVWTPDQARRFLAYTKSIGGKIAATEFMNEPNFAAVSRGAPKGYDAAAFARDIAAFRPFLKQTAPETLFLGPGSTGEGGPVGAAMSNAKLGSEALLQAAGPVFDVFSYHIYVAASQRCGTANTPVGTTAADALSAKWLSRPDSVTAYYKGLRDRFEPGKALWVTEMADAACGGNPWASTFLDTFRYLDQHAALAQQGVRVVAHNTLAASDYGLLDETTFFPRPNYWAALLWNKLMGTTVLKPASTPAESFRVYAHCMRGVPGGVTILAINTDRNEAKSLTVSAPAERYTMTASALEGTSVELNGKELKLGADDSLPELRGTATPAGSITLAPLSITFLAAPEAHNASCR